MMKIILNKQTLKFSFIIIILKKYSIIILEKIKFRINTIK